MENNEFNLKYGLFEKDSSTSLTIEKQPFRAKVYSKLVNEMSCHISIHILILLYNALSYSVLILEAVHQTQLNQEDTFVNSFLDSMKNVSIDFHVIYSKPALLAFFSFFIGLFVLQICIFYLKSTFVLKIASWLIFLVTKVFAISSINVFTSFVMNFIEFYLNDIETHMKFDTLVVITGFIAFFCFLDVHFSSSIYFNDLNLFQRKTYFSVITLGIRMKTSLNIAMTCLLVDNHIKVEGFQVKYIIILVKLFLVLHIFYISSFKNRCFATTDTFLHLLEFTFYFTIDAVLCIIVIWDDNKIQKFDLVVYSVIFCSILTASQMFQSLSLEKAKTQNYIMIKEPMAAVQFAFLLWDVIFKSGSKFEQSVIAFHRNTHTLNCTEPRCFCKDDSSNSASRDQMLSETFSDEYKLLMRILEFFVQKFRSHRKDFDIINIMVNIALTEHNYNSIHKLLSYKSLSNLELVNFQYFLEVTNLNNEISRRIFKRETNLKIKKVLKYELEYNKMTRSVGEIVKNSLLLYDKTLMSKVNCDALYKLIFNIILQTKEVNYSFTKLKRIDSGEIKSTKLFCFLFMTLYENLAYVRSEFNSLASFSEKAGVNNNEEKTFFKSNENPGVVVASGNLEDMSSIIYVNKNLIDIYKYPKNSDMLGKNLKILMPDFFALHHDNLVKNFFRKDESLFLNQTISVIGTDSKQISFEVKVNVKIYPNLLEGIFFIGFVKASHEAFTGFIIYNEEEQVLSASEDAIELIGLDPTIFYRSKNVCFNLISVRDIFDHSTAEFLTDPSKQGEELETEIDLDFVNANQRNKGVECSVDGDGAQVKIIGSFKHRIFAGGKIQFYCLNFKIKDRQQRQKFVSQKSLRLNISESEGLSLNSLEESVDQIELFDKSVGQNKEIESDSSYFAVTKYSIISFIAIFTLIAVELVTENIWLYSLSDSHNTYMHFNHQISDLMGVSFKFVYTELIYLEEQCSKQQINPECYVDKESKLKETKNTLKEAYKEVEQTLVKMVKDEVSSQSLAYLQAEVDFKHLVLSGSSFKESVKQIKFFEFPNELMTFIEYLDENLEKVCSTEMLQEAKRIVSFNLFTELETKSQDFQSYLKDEQRNMIDFIETLELVFFLTCLLIWTLIVVNFYLYFRRIEASKRNKITRLCFTNRSLVENKIANIKGFQGFLTKISSDSKYFSTLSRMQQVLDAYRRSKAPSVKQADSSQMVIKEEENAALKEEIKEEKKILTMEDKIQNKLIGPFLLLSLLNCVVVGILFLVKVARFTAKKNSFDVFYYKDQSDFTIYEIMMMAASGVEQENLVEVNEKHNELMLKTDSNLSKYYETANYHHLTAFFDRIYKDKDFFCRHLSLCCSEEYWVKGTYLNFYSHLRSTVTSKFSAKEAEMVVKSTDLVLIAGAEATFELNEIEQEAIEATISQAKDTLNLSLLINILVCFGTICIFWLIYLYRVVDYILVNRNIDGFRPTTVKFNP